MLLIEDESLENFDKSLGSLQKRMAAVWPCQPTTAVRWSQTTIIPKIVQYHRIVFPERNIETPAYQAKGCLVYDTSNAFSRMAHVSYHLTPAAELQNRSLCTVKTTCAST